MTGATTVERLKMKLRMKAPASRPQSPTSAPTPAWRYESPTGYRLAVVRVYCMDTARTRSIGSGVLVKWGSKIVVLTARHVVQDAIKSGGKIVVEFFNERTQEVRVLKIDATWDYAVLQLSSIPQDVSPAEVELSDEAMQKAGDRLESCGYGPDGKLACNSGLFLGYKRSEKTPNGPDDWMAISGRARGGDSGGPIFNAKGRVVGILWGTNGSEVIGVQAGRLHVLLDAALPDSYEQKQFFVRQPTEPKQATPNCCPKPGPESCEDSKLSPAGDCSQSDCSRQEASPDRRPQADSHAATLSSADGPRTPTRFEEHRRQDGRLDPERQPPVSGESQPETEASPLAAGLCILGGLATGFVIYFSTQKQS